MFTISENDVYLRNYLITDVDSVMSTEKTFSVMDTPF